MTKFTVPQSLAKLSKIQAYSDEGFEAKEVFHKSGISFLKSLAKELGSEIGEFTVRSNKGGIAVSGEVTLHSDNLYVQLFESCLKPGVSMLYRSCTSQKDYSGGRNHEVSLKDIAFDNEGKDRVLAEMRSLVDTEIARKRELFAT